MKNKSYRLIMQWMGYSKKKGGYMKRKVIAKDIATYDDAVAFIKKEYPKAIIKDNIATNIGGLLHPSTIEIK